MGCHLNFSLGYKSECRGSPDYQAFGRGATVVSAYMVPAAASNDFDILTRSLVDIIGMYAVYHRWEPLLKVGSPASLHLLH